MEQRTDDWLSWRNQGIGSSDAPVVLGVSPYMTRFGLWELKTGRAKPKEANWAMQRGNELEPKARAEYELISDIDMPPQLAVHPKYAFMRASLDGFNASKRRVLEIKFAGREDHALAKAGKVPEKYMPQCQHQLLVTGAELLDYFSFDGNRGVIVPVEPDLKFQARLIEEEEAFWDLVQRKVAPDLSDRDYATVKDPQLRALFRKYKAAEKRAKKAAASVEALKGEIKGAVKDVRVMYAGVRVLRFERAGNIDYKKVPQLHGVDLEQYRSAPITVTQISVVKE